MSKLKVKNVTLGDNADTSKNISINVPATADGSLTIETEAGTDLAVLNASGMSLTGTFSASTGINIGTTPITRQVLGTVTPTNASQTSHIYSDIPSWVKRITLNFFGTSISGTSSMIIQIGPVAGVETATYQAMCANILSATASCTAYTTGFGVATALAASTFHGSVTLTLLNPASNIWVCSGNLANNATTGIWLLGGSKALAGPLTQLRIYTLNGTDTFDAGSMNIMYEG